MEFDYSLEPGKVLKDRYETITEDPLVSIITPYYNAGKYFEQTFNCVLNQTFPYFEWIIVNDGSTEQEDVVLLQDFASKDSRIKVYHKENGGAAGARNYGIRNSRSNVIVFLDADDLIDERYVEYTFWALKQNSKATWAYTDSLGFGETQYLWQRGFKSETMKKENVLSYIAAIRKDAFSQENIYDDASKNMWEDWQFWLKLLAEGCYPVHINQIMFWYRRQQSGTLAKIEMDVTLKKSLKNRIGDLAKKVPNDITAITFGGKRANEFEKPHTWEWNTSLCFRQKKTRLLLLIPHMEYGGADKFNLDILKNINKEKYEIGIITTNPASNEWRQEFAKYVVDIFELPNFLDMSDWSAFIHYYIKSRDVKIIWNISSYYGYYTLPWLRSEFPQVAIMDCVHAEGNYWRAGGYPRVSAALDDVLEKTFVTNTFTYDIMAKKYGKDSSKMQIIYTGVDETELDPEKVDCSKIKQQLEIGEGRPIVLFLCRIAPEKRPFLMIEIAKQVRKHIKNICFLVVGDGPQINELRNKVRTEGLENTVYIIGRQDDIKPYYKVSDLFLLSSIKEGLSITTLEAMLMGKPVVSANVGSQYELVNDATGRIIPCLQDEQKDFNSRNFSQDEISGYVNAICELLSEKVDLREMGNACRQKILNGFTLSCLMDTLHKEFDALLLPEAVEKRVTLAHALKQFEKVMEDYLTLYITYEAKDLEAKEIWCGREWYRLQCVGEIEKKCCVLEETLATAEAVSYTDSEISSCCQSQAELRLNEIYSMRTWKLMEKYRKFMDCSFVGKILKKIRDIFR